MGPQKTFFVAHPSQLSIIKCSLPLNPYTKISGPSPHPLPKPGSFYYTNTLSTIHLAFYDTRVSKCGPMQKDQGVGTVVNNLLQLNLGYHMVFKVVILKIKKGKSKLFSPAIKYIKKYFFKLLCIFSFIHMCGYNWEPAYSQFQIETNTKHNARNEFPKILINNKHLYISPIYYPYVLKINAT